MFHPGWRRQALSRLGQPFDLVIVGGGITGCGVLLEAAQRGLQALLVERGDLGCGTSSRSSKLAHGGLRYLKQGKLRLTRTALVERDRMVELDPHLVRPLPFVFPTYRVGRLPGWQVGMGLALYDLLATGRQRHRRLAPAELERLAPGLSTEGLDRAFLYWDAWADDARLTLAVAATAFAYGGLVLPRAEPEEGLRDPGGRLAGLVLRDLESGEVHRVAARLVVNATGAWADTVRERLGFAGRRLRPSRGSHLVFAAERLPLQAAVTIPSPDDGRPVFFLPHPEGVLAGTTDLYHDGSLDDPRPSRREVDYILRTVQAAFPGRGIGTGDVRGAFAGLRPIPAEAREVDPSKVTREEVVWWEGELLSVAGGKLTTWRAMAEDVVDRALRRLPPERARAAAGSVSAGTPVGALAPADLPERLIARGLDPALAPALARRLGGLAWAALDLARDGRDLQPLRDGSDLTAAEVRAHLRWGAALRLEDLLLRRARVGMWDPPLARELLAPVAALAAAELGWDGARREREEGEAAAALVGWSPAGVEGAG